MDSNNPNAALKRKLQKLYEIKLENPELVHSLKDLSTFYVKNTLENRWNLRDVLENRAFNEQKNFLESFDIVEKVSISQPNYSYNYSDLNLMMIGII
jgi:hypothetical protein